MSAVDMQAAMNAHTNLNTFGAIIAILEGGCIYGSTSASAGKTEKKIIALCKAEQQRQLKIMDKATGREA